MLLQEIEFHPSHSRAYRTRALSRALALSKSERISKMFFSRVSSDFASQKGNSLTEIDGFKEFEEIILENLQMIIETFNFLEYSQIELYRGISQRKSKVFRELGTV